MIRRIRRRLAPYLHAEADSRSSPPDAAVSRYGPVVLRSASGVHELGNPSVQTS
jgi:hypothetical protein